MIPNLKDSARRHVLIFETLTGDEPCFGGKATRECSPAELGTVLAMKGSL